jgi:hypothetical protein
MNAGDKIFTVFCCIFGVGALVFFAILLMQFARIAFERDCVGSGCSANGERKYRGFCARCWLAMPDADRQRLSGKPADVPKLAYRIPASLKLHRIYFAVLAAVLTPGAARWAWHFIGRIL